MPVYRPSQNRLAPQQLYFGQGATGLIPPHPSGDMFFSSNLLLEINLLFAPNLVVSYNLQRQGQPGERMSFRRGQRMQQQILGGLLNPLVENIEQEYTGKVTGMLLEMDQTEALHLIESPDTLQSKVAEAIEVLRLAQAVDSDAADQLGSLSLSD